MLYKLGYILQPPPQNTRIAEAEKGYAEAGEVEDIPGRAL